jgi:hypothetical protein
MGEAVADGPILFRGIENGHEHVLGTEGGAREVATWFITLSVCAASIVIGFLFHYILVGNRKA